jgi:Ran GTPase-activating protein (RanGAP) involved in mRNA processing and transport
MIDGEVELACACTVQMGPGAADLLGSAHKLRKLSLFDSHLGDEGACTVADRLSAASFVQLMELELSACRIGTVGMVRLFDVLESQAAPALEVQIPLNPLDFSP